MSYYGAHWRIDGVTAAFIMRGDRNGRYRIVFERESAELPQIESINWAQPSVERLTEAGEFGLPEGYGFELVKITYDSAVKSYTVEVKTARQYLGDVTGYQAQVEALSNTLAAREQQVEELAGQQYRRRRGRAACRLYGGGGAQWLRCWRWPRTNSGRKEWRMLRRWRSGLCPVR